MTLKPKWTAETAGAYERREQKQFMDEVVLVPKREWVGLTDEEREELMDNYDVASTDYAQAIEAKLKEKNT